MEIITTWSEGTEPHTIQRVYWRPSRSVFWWSSFRISLKAKINLKFTLLRFEVFTAMTMKNAVFLDKKNNLYVTEDTLRLCHTFQPVNAM
jgi:hypothetical protein